MSYYPSKNKNAQSDDDQQGQIRSSSSSDQDVNQLEEAEAEGEINNGDDEIYDSASSEEDRHRIEEDKKKREDFWKAINQQVKPEDPQSIKNVFESALQSASKTNKKMLILRKKNIKRIQQLETLRMSQQPHLLSINTHYRSSINEYPLLTIDDSGKKCLHPNTSLRVLECRLDQFIQKNIAEEGTSNYLNEVVKFENYAYQHRKKRRQNFQ